MFLFYLLIQTKKIDFINLIPLSFLIISNVAMNNYGKLGNITK